MSSAPELRPERIPNTPPATHKGHVCRPYLFCRRCWGTAFACHAVLFAVVVLFVPSASRAPRADRPVALVLTQADLRDDELSDDVMFEMEEELAEAQGEEPIIKDEVVTDRVETDHDLESEVSFGESEGLSDAPFEGPANNGTIGIGGGSGGAFKGRGGSRDLGVGGGGRRRTNVHPTTWKRSRLAANRMRLKLGTKKYLPLRALSVRATIEGFRARVVMECDYENDQTRGNLEGTFQWRLPDGASPYYLAFGHLAQRPGPRGGSTPLATDLASLRNRTAQGVTAMKEARIVPRAKAAKAYTETVRRRIDPALMEWAGAGVFQTRVFPLQPLARHRITVGYEINLEARGAEQVFELDLPSDVGDVTAEIAVREPSSDGAATWTTRTYRNPSDLPLRLSVPNQGATLLRDGTRATMQTFAAQFTPDVPKGCGSAGQSRAVFLLDTSFSSAASFETWLALLEVHLDGNRDRIAEFAVGFFNVESYWWRPGFTANTPENVAALLADSRDAVLEGASDLGTALRMAGARPGAFDCFLLSDGAATWGETDAAVLATRLGAGRRCFAYRGIAAGTDGQTLAALAQATDGAVFAVTEADDLRAVATAHRCARWTLEEVRVPGGLDVVVQGRPRHIYPGQTVYVAGRGRPSVDTTVELVLRGLAGEQVVRVPVQRSFDSELATSTYGQIAVESLEALGPVVADTARAYALHFRTVGKTCSLLMLDSERDYSRFDIAPEEDSEVVRLTRVGELLERITSEQHDDLLDAKARFLAWLDELGRQDARAQLPDARTWIESLPTEAFRIDSEVLVCKARTQDPGSDKARENVTGALLEKLAQAAATAHGPADALRVYSRAVEQSPGDPVAARGTAFAARALGFPGHAHRLLTRALRARPFESSAYLAVASCLADIGKPDLARIHFELAWALTRSRKIVAVNYLGFLRRAGERYADALNKMRLPELQGSVGIETADVVVTLSWNTDRTDVDLHVEDPSGETCSYNHTRTKIGGHITDDIQGGFGPEMFTLPKGPAGTYLIRAHMYNTDSRRLGTGTRVWLTTIEDWGRPTEQVRHKHLLLGDQRKLLRLEAFTRDTP